MRNSLNCSLLAATVLVAGPAVSQTQTETHVYDNLGRLIVTNTVGGPNDNETRSYCFDELGNRKIFKSSESGVAAACAPQTSPQPPAPDPPAPIPPPSSSGTPPTANDDWIRGGCQHTTTANLTANDSDAEDAPIKPKLIAIGQSSNSMAGATRINDSSASVDFSDRNSLVSVPYTIRDSAGQTASGNLIIETTGCGGIID